MLIYSEALHAFSLRCEKYLKEILRDETPYLVSQSMFQIGGYKYPIHVVTFESKSLLGYFNHDFYHIGINKNLSYNAKSSVLKNILKHELAHYLTSILYPEHKHPHGDEFKRVCRDLNWGPDISNSQLEIMTENNQIEGEIKQEKLMGKVKKLLELSKSSNTHEAQLALLKANDLIHKHQLTHISSDQEFYFSKSALTYKRKSAKLMAIYEIVSTFFVRPILHYGKGFVNLDLVGKKDNLLFACYVVDYLDSKLESLWNQAKQESALKGRAAKNSFFLGVAHGYRNHIKGNTDLLRSNELVLSQTQAPMKLFFKQTSKTSSSSTRDQDSYQLGKKKGQSLSINRPLTNKTKKLLNWSLS